MKTFTKVAAVLGAATMTVLAASTPASAAVATTNSKPCVVAVAQFNAAHASSQVSDDVCTITTQTRIDSASIATPTAIESDAGLSADQKSSLLVAGAAATIHSAHYSQATFGAAYTQTQDGTFYYDGTRVWVTVTTSGLKGTHYCVTNYAVGVSITNESCSESGSSSVRNMYDQWRVSWVVNGSPLSYDVSMTWHLHANGTGS